MLRDQPGCCLLLCTSHPPLSLAVPEFLWILSSLSPDVISGTKWLLMGRSCPAVVWEGRV